MGRPKNTDEVDSLNRAERPHRTPINGSRSILDVQGQEPGWHYCWVNDEKVPRFENAAYEFVTHDVIVGDKRIDAAGRIGNKVSIPAGNGVTAYLMRILDEYYTEDMEALHADLDEKEQAMYQELNSGSDGRYGEVRINHAGKRR